MGQIITLTAADGHKFAAYRADPAGKPRGGLVVVQEIFGVNNHMRHVTDGFAADGYACVAPALFDRVKTGVELGYGPDDIAAGRELRGKISWEQVGADIAAAAAALQGTGKIGIVGYCWGGSVAFYGATVGGFAAAVGYYGGNIASMAERKPRCPTMLHFGDKDASIPMSDVDKVRAARPEIEYHIYPAGHGFSCDERASFHAESDKLARERTLAFFRKHIG